MSWQATNAVVRHSQSKGSARLLLLVIANHVGAEGRAAYPSVATLCAETRLSERTVRYLLRDLEARGELGVTFKAGPGQTNLYRVLLPGAGGEAAGVGGWGSGVREEPRDPAETPSLMRPASSKAGLPSTPNPQSPTPAASASQPSPVGQSAARVGRNGAQGGAMMGAPKLQGKGKNKDSPPPPREVAASSCGNEGEDGHRATPEPAKPNVASGVAPDGEMPRTVAALLAVCGTVRGGWRDEAELAALLPWLREQGLVDEIAAGMVRQRFAPPVWDKPTPPRLSQIRREWARMGWIVEHAARPEGSPSERGASREANRGSGFDAARSEPANALSRARIPRATGRERAFQGRQKLRAEYLAVWGAEG